MADIEGERAQSGLLQMEWIYLNLKSIYKKNQRLPFYPLKCNVSVVREAGNV